MGVTLAIKNEIRQSVTSCHFKKYLHLHLDNVCIVPGHNRRFYCFYLLKTHTLCHTRDTMRFNERIGCRNDQTRSLNLTCTLAL